MKRSKMMLAAVASAAVVSAGVVPAALAMTGPSTQATNPGNGNGNGTPGSGQQCGYPSNRTPNISLAANPTSIRRGATTVLSGRMSGNGCGIAGTVGLYAQTNGRGAYSLVVTTTADGNGSFSFAPQAPAQTTNYRATFAGNTNYDAVNSNTVTVTVANR